MHFAAVLSIEFPLEVAICWLPSTVLDTCFDDTHEEDNVAFYW